MKYIIYTNYIALQYNINTGPRVRTVTKISSTILIVTQANIINKPNVNITHRMNNLISPFFQMSCIVQNLEK